jgi:hypothetical protein
MIFTIFIKCRDSLFAGEELNRLRGGNETQRLLEEIKLFLICSS